jgi:hypothetical protein
VRRRLAALKLTLVRRPRTGAHPVAPCYVMLFSPLKFLAGNCARHAAVTSVRGGHIRRCTCVGVTCVRSSEICAATLGNPMAGAYINRPTLVLRAMRGLPSLSNTRICTAKLAHGSMELLGIQELGLCQLEQPRMVVCGHEGCQIRSRMERVRVNNRKSMHMCSTSS